MNKELLDLMHLFDCIAGELSRYVFHADEYQFPTLLRTDVLKKLVTLILFLICGCLFTD